MNISARNVVKGKVKNVTTGAVNSEVIIELPGGIELCVNHYKIICRKAKFKRGRRGFYGD